MNNWERIEQIFDEAIELPPSDRPAFLDHACQGDPVLRAEVESLLAAESGGARLIPEAVSRLSSSILASDESGRLGPYQLDHKIGEGGMGTVFLAHRADDEYRHEVAIKLVRVRGQLALSRFRHERQILAALDHPNIARLLDGGTSPNGLPYFVMEYIRGGLPITEFCDQKKLSQKSRLELFLKVAAAVQHAHQRLIIHRDIKPANILVTPEGDPKLLDFGIAKLLDPERAKGTILETLTGMQLLTPDYASAEQVRGGPITTATDVYSLGLVLFEMLTGHRAQKLTTYSAEEVVRVVCETELPKPNLGSDLDNILGMALRKEPDRRYATVDQFAADIQRFLNHHPVLARPDSWRYRAAKFTRRNRWPVALAALLLLALAGGIAATTWQARVASHRFNQVRALANKFVFDVDDELYRVAGAMKARQMLVSTSLQYLDALGADAAGDRALALEIAGAYVKVGDVLGGENGSNLGKTAEAIDSWNKAIDIYQRLGTRSPEIAEKYGRALMRRGRAIRSTGKQKEGLADQQLAVSLLDASGANSSERALAHCFLGDQLLQLSGPEPALVEMRRCAELLLAAGVPAADALTRSGAALVELGRLEDAARDLDAAIRSYRQRLAADPHNGRALRESAVALLRLSGIHAQEDAPSLGNFPAALQYAREAIAIYRDLAAKDPANKEALQSATIAEVRLAYLLDAGEGKSREAAATLQNCITTFEAIHKNNPKNQVAQARIGAARLYLARILERQGNLPAAIREALAALNIQDALAGPKRDSTLTTVRISPRVTLARLYRKQGDPARARELLLPALNRVRKSEADNSAISARMTRASFYAELGRLTNDPALLEDAIRLYSGFRSAGVSKSVWDEPLRQLSAEQSALPR